MREMAFLPHQDYMIFQPHHHHHHHEFNDDQHHHHDDPSISLNILSSCPPQDFHANDGAVIPSLPIMNRSMSFPTFHHHNNHDQDQEDGAEGEGDDASDDGSQVMAGGEKKKRLSMEQVRALEKTFEQGNKLEPERKVQLAKTLGLQPRQVAIWFQNRRARWKTKQLEKDYSLLKRQFDALEADNQSLVEHNKKLHAQLLSLRGREEIDCRAINLNNADSKSYWSNNRSDISSDINLSNPKKPQIGSPLSSNPSTTNLQFPSNSFIPNNFTQLFQSSQTKPEIDLQCPKVEPNLQEDIFCNIFGGNNDDSGHGGVDQNQPPNFWA